MHPRRFCLCALLLPGLALVSLTIHAEDSIPPDMILTNGRIFTAYPAAPRVDALSIQGKLIQAIGTSAEITALAGPKTVRIDLEGRLVVPGFNDAHFHHNPTPSGTQLKLSFPEPTWAEVLGALPEAVNSAPNGSWIYGSVGSVVLNDPEAARAALDTLAPEHPVLIQTWFGHGQVFNSQAMRRLGIADDEPDPMGGHWIREPGSQRITGKSFEYAAWRPLRRLEDSCSDEEIIASLQQLADEASRYGITSIQNMTVLPLARYVRLVGASKFPLRMRVIRFAPTDTKGRDVKDGIDLPTHPKDAPLLAVSGTKWVLDGTPLERGMAVRTEYHDRPGWSGKENFADSEVAAMLNEAISRKEQSLFHAVGDKTVSTVLNSMRAVDPDPGQWSSRRVRIEHGDGLLADLVPLARELGIVLIQNPTHFDPAMSHIIDRFGPDMKYMPLRSLLDAGIPVGLGSDGPMNPGLNLMFAVIHPAQPAEAITLDQALTAYTNGSAFAEFAEQDKGSLSPGKLADLAVLSQDLFKVSPQQFPRTQSLLTLVDGKPVFDSSVLKRTVSPSPNP